MSTQDTVEIPFRTLARGSANPNSGGGLFFCRNQLTWAARWRGLHYLQVPEPPLPQVDWATDMVALLVCGTRPTGGYKLRIESIAIDDAWVEVRAVERRPRTRCNHDASAHQPVPRGSHWRIRRRRTSDTADRIRQQRAIITG